MPFKIITLFVLLVVCNGKIQEEESLSIFLSPFPAPGHYLNFMILGDALKEQGHNVTFLMPHFPDYDKPMRGTWFSLHSCTSQYELLLV